jgi:hypothetical protein
VDICSTAKTTLVSDERWSQGIHTAKEKMLEIKSKRIKNVSRIKRKFQAGYMCWFYSTFIDSCAVGAAYCWV